MKQIKEGGLYRATFVYNPNMAAPAVNTRLIALGQGFSELFPPEVPRLLVVPAAVVTKDERHEVRELRVQLGVIEPRQRPAG